MCQLLKMFCVYIEDDFNEQWLSTCHNNKDNIYIFKGLTSYKCDEPTLMAWLIKMRLLHKSTISRITMRLLPVTCH